jgi:hypothetical protein
MLQKLSIPHIILLSILLAACNTSPELAQPEVARTVSLITAIPIPTETGSPTPEPTATTTPEATFTPTATIDADQTIYDNFGNPANDGSYNEGQWSTFLATDTEYSQQDGILKISRTGDPEESSGLSAIHYIDFTLEDPTFFEAKLMLDPEHHEGYVQFQLWGSLPGDDAWFTQCLIIPTTTVGWGQIFCWDSVWPEQPGHSYFSEVFYIELGTWHSVRIEFDPTTTEFTYFIDEREMGSNVPVDAERIGDAEFTLSISVWSETEEEVVGYFDNVRIGPLED